jgi:hypothetical protein
LWIKNNNKKKMMMKMKPTILLMIILTLGLIAGVSALDEERQERIDFGYVLLIKDIQTDPANIVPGQSAELKIILQNNANFRLFDVRGDIELPSGISFENDVSRRKVFRMDAGEVTEMTYHLITSPTISEGIYEGNFSIQYLNHVATERTEDYEFGLVVKSTPLIFVEVDESTIYQGKPSGEITVKFVNNDIGDIKFLTVELEGSEDFEVIGPRKQYIGDLDSDDFESVEYKLKIKNEEKQLREEVPLILKLNYKDALNNPYTGSVETSLKIRSPTDLGIKGNGTLIIVIVIIVALIVAYIVYRRIKKKRRKREKY